MKRHRWDGVAFSTYRCRRCGCVRHQGVGEKRWRYYTRAEVEASSGRWTYQRPACEGNEGGQ